VHPGLTRVIAAAGLLVFLLAATGCDGIEDRDQARARRAVEETIAGSDRYPGERIHCTRTPRAWLVERKTSLYLCAVPLGTGFCDVYLVRFGDGFRKTVSLHSRKADCTLPI
jgi:hypothetical protein